MLNIFLENNVIGLLNNMDLDLDSVPFQDAIIELIELPLTCVAQKEEDTLNFQIYYRDEIKTNSSVYRSGIFRKGETLSTEKDDKFLVLLIATMKHALVYLKQEGILEQCTAMDENTSGVLLSEKDSQVNVTIVHGRSRPALQCTTLQGSVRSCRPYMDEFMMDMTMSMEEKEAEAEAGDTVLMEQLAMMYLNGDEVDQNPEKAVYWFRKLAETGDSNGMFNLALHYAKGFGVERDFNQAAYWMTQAAEHGDEDAPAITEKYAKAAVAQEKAAAGDAQAQADLAGVLMGLGGSLDQAGTGKDYEDAFTLAEKSAAQGNGDGIWTLALAYEHGRAVDKDAERAVELYRQGAEIGHAPSQHSLGCYYMRGEIVPKDEEKAFELILKSARQGYGLGMRSAGACYQFGNGVQDDMNTAIYWFEKYLENNSDPELEQKVALFKQLMQQEAQMGNDSAQAEENLPEGYMEALEAFAAHEAEPEVVTLGKTLRYLDAKVDAKAGIATITEEVMGTQFEGRNQRIEYIHVGDTVQLIREPENEKNDQNIAVRNRNGESLGNLSSGCCSILAPLMDAGYADKVTAKVTEAIPVSKRGPRAKKSILKLEITIHFENAVQCTLCKLGGDQVRTWAQELTVWSCTLPTAHAKLLFELYNRFNEEYDKLDRGENDTSYAGLDNLEEEIRAAREQMQAQRIPGADYSRGAETVNGNFGAYVLQCIGKEPERYGVLKQYGVDPFAGLEEIFWNHCIGEKKYYWLDQTRVPEEEFSQIDGYNHWYDILELYDGLDLPVDLNDEDVVSIFGCGKFAAFADLSYGC